VSSLLHRWLSLESAPPPARDAVGALAEACLERVGCYGTAGVAVDELWRHVNTVAGCGAHPSHARGC